MNTDYEKVYQFFKNTLKPLMDLEKGDKLKLIENTYEINNRYFNSNKIKYVFELDKVSYLQGINRWLNSQNRKDVIMYLYLYFEELIEFSYIMKKENPNIYFSLKKDFKDLVNRLYLIIETYNDEKISHLITQILNNIYILLK